MSILEKWKHKMFPNTLKIKQINLFFFFSNFGEQNRKIILTAEKIINFQYQTG